MRSLSSLHSLLHATFLYVLLLPYALTGVGAALNQAVLIANHDTFPVLMNATQAQTQFIDDPAHVPMTHQTHLNALGDIFDFHDGWISFGDLLLAAGKNIELPCFYIWMTLVLKELIDQRRV